MSIQGGLELFRQYFHRSECHGIMILLRHTSLSGIGGEEEKTEKPEMNPCRGSKVCNRYMYPVRHVHLCHFDFGG
jgi:hypothetical protein